VCDPNYRTASGRQKRQPPSRRSGALARREDGRTGAIQDASRMPVVAAKRASVLECGPDAPGPLSPLNLLKVNYLSLFDKKELTNGIDGFILRAVNANEITPKANPWLNRIQKSSVYLKNILFISTVIFGVIGLLGFVITMEGVYPPLSYSVSLFSLADGMECWFAYKLFSYYVTGDLFGRKAVRWMRWLGILCLLRGGGNIWHTLYLRLHDGYFYHIQGSPFIVQIILYLHWVFFELVHNLVFGCIIIFIAWIMDEGRKIQEEQELTV
jgi:hypothetical protein